MSTIKRTTLDNQTVALLDNPGIASAVAENGALDHVFTRRRLLGAAGVGALAFTNPTWAETIHYPMAPERGRSRPPFRRKGR
jgi:hypothetical protein